MFSKHLKIAAVKRASEFRVAGIGAASREIDVIDLIGCEPST
jgi:hypothetical protein